MDKTKAVREMSHDREGVGEWLRYLIMARVEANPQNRLLTRAARAAVRLVGLVTAPHHPVDTGAVLVVAVLSVASVTWVIIR